MSEKQKFCSTVQGEGLEPPDPQWFLGCSIQLLQTFLVLNLPAF